MNRALPRLALLAFASALIATLALRANAKPFWHDEIYTIVCARLPSISALWQAHRQGLDLSPPLNSLLTMAVFRLGGAGRVMTRLPALAGFLCAEWAVFEIVRKRSSALSGFTAALLLCFTAALRYAYEARGYGLMLGAFALALYAWSEAARGSHRRVHVPLLALALAAGCWAQYFGVLAFVPIGAGEVVRSLKTRTIDRPVWIAAAIAAVALLPLVPLVRAGSSQAATFWAHASAADLGAIYRFLLQPLMYSVVGYAAAAIVIALAFGLLRRGRAAPMPLAPLYEVVAACLCVLLPAVGLVAAISSTGVFVPRYGLNGTVGFAIAAPLLIAYLSNGAGLAPLVLPIVLSIGFAQGVVGTVRHAGDPFVDPFEQRPALAAAARQPRPVVITGGLMYLQLWYYAPPAARTHLWYIADPAQSMRYTGTDTIDQGYRVLRDRVALNAPDYATFIAQHHDFVLYGAGSGWLTARLAEDGARMEPAGTELGAPIADVTVR